MSFKISKKIVFATLIVLVFTSSILVTFFVTKNHYMDEIAYVKAIGWELNSVSVDGNLEVGGQVIFTIEFGFPTGGYSVLPPVVLFSDEYSHNGLWIKVYVIEPTGIVTFAVVNCVIQQIVIFPTSGNWTVRC
ncbi:MAG: hypothetical protein ACTSUP_07360, partial [Candidatus Heimdallarchaeaceae archaeon]